jgi:hypothetical protein
MSGLNADDPERPPRARADPPFRDEQVGNKPHPGIDHIEVHRIDPRVPDQNELPRPERNGGEGERKVYEAPYRLLKEIEEKLK